MVRPSTLERHGQQGKCRCFLLSLLGLLYPKRELEFSLLFLYLNLRKKKTKKKTKKKQAFHFLKRNSYTNVCLYMFGNASSYFLISSKKVMSKQDFHTDTF